MASVRLEKVAALVRKEMSTLFQLNMNSMFGGVMITVTNVRVSPDMGLAKVYLSIFPTERKDETMALLEEKNGLLRKMLADKIAKQLRKAPELRFYLDDSLDYFEEIDRLLKK
jgi:ribosome-binding factor A